MGYQITDTEARGNGNFHSKIIHPETYIEVIIPAGAKKCIKPDTGEIFYTFNTEIDGGQILVQAYGAEPEETATFELLVREKRLANGYKFLYCKLTRTDKEPNATEAQIVSGAYLRSLRHWSKLPMCTIIECPQKKHDGAVIIVPLGLELPEDEETLVRESRANSKKWTRVTRARKTASAR